ncbi:MAG: NADH-quinone oxidoreductase subunit J [Gemmatimonadota bacterium]
MITDFLFFSFAVATILGALLVITRRNPVASVMYLVVVFFSLSGLFLLLGAQFIAALQVILYAGAIMVLFLFVVMLLNLGHAPRERFGRPLGRFIAGSLGIALVATVTKLLLMDARPLPSGPGGLPAPLAGKGAVELVAEPLFLAYAVPFEVTGLLLLVAIVGTVVLARRRAP